MEAPTILVKTWACWRCSFRNWPSRVNCRVCGTVRQGNENRIDDRWAAARIPPGCVADAMPPGGGRTGPAGRGGGTGNEPTHHLQPSVRRIPGLGPMPTGRKVLPSSASGLPGGGGRTTPAGEGQPQRRQVGEGSQGGKGGGGGKGGKGGAEGSNGTREPARRGAASDADETSTTWAKVVRGPSGKRRTVQDEEGGERGGEEAESDQEMDEGGGDSEEGLPPPRVFDPPMEPREVIQRKAEAAAAKARRAKARGAGDGKVSRAEAEADGLAKKLRDAGGSSPTALLFQIKGEEKKKASSVKAIEALQKRIAEEEEEVLKRRVGIQRLHRLVERHQERLEVSEKRLLYLASQKHSESMPLARVSELRSSTRALAAMVATTGQQMFNPILEHFAGLISSEAHDLEQGDTSEDCSQGLVGQDESDVTEEEMDEEGPSKHVDWGEYEGPYASQLREARDALRKAQRDKLEAVQSASEGQRASVKRPFDGEGPRCEDAAGDIEMVPTLTAAQAEEVHRGAIKEAADKYRHLRTLAAREMATAEEPGQQQQRQHQQQPPRGAPAPPGTPPQPCGGGKETASASSSVPAAAAAAAAAATPGRPSAAAEGGEEREGEAAGAGHGGTRAQCVLRYQTAEEREEERGRWRARAGRSRGRSLAPRGQGGREAQAGEPCEEMGERGRHPAPVTPVDPQVARGVQEGIREARRNIAERMDYVKLQLDTREAEERIRQAVAINSEIRMQERMQQLQEVEFAEACARRASGAGLHTLHTEQQCEEVRRLYVADMLRQEESQREAPAFTMHGPTGVPLEEHQRALRRAVRTANLGEAASSGYGGGSGAAPEEGAQGGLPRRSKSTGEPREMGRSRSKSPKQRAGAKARRGGGWD